MCHPFLRLLNQNQGTPPIILDPERSATVVTDLPEKRDVSSRSRVVRSRICSKGNPSEKPGISNGKVRFGWKSKGVLGSKEYRVRRTIIVKDK